MSTTKDLKEALAQLGTTSDEVAWSLRRLGIRGNKNSGATCPIANYLRPLFSWFHSIDAVQIYQTYSPTFGEDPEEDYVGVCSCPAPIDEFINRFDEDGDYPDLEVKYAYPKWASSALSYIYPKWATGKTLSWT